jgi:hypothetical protein
MTTDTITIHADTREPWPHPWQRWLPSHVQLERMALDTGDFALAVIPAAAVIERKMGEMLRQTERAKGRLKRGPVVTARNHGDAPSLSTLGLSKRESAAAQELAALPQDRFEALLAGEVTRARQFAERSRKNPPSNDGTTKGATPP